MRACTPPIQAWKSAVSAGLSGVVTSAIFTILRREPLQRLENFAFEHLDLLLRRLQLLLAEARELQPALVGGERLLERKLAAFHARDDFLQLGERLLETEPDVFGRFTHRLVKYCFSRSFTTHGGCCTAQGATAEPAPLAGVLVLRPRNLRAGEEAAVSGRSELRRPRADGIQGGRLPYPRAHRSFQDAGAQRVGRGAPLERLPPSPVHHAPGPRQYREHRLPAAPLDLRPQGRAARRAA